MPEFLSVWPLPKANGRTRYIPLEKENCLDEAQSHTSATPIRSPWRHVMNVVHWLSTFFFAFSTLWLIVERAHPQPLGSFAAGWATDFGIASAMLFLVPLANADPRPQSQLAQLLKFKKYALRAVHLFITIKLSTYPTKIQSTMLANQAH